MLFPILASACAARADDWPQWRGARRDGVWRETGITDTLPEGKIPRRWSVPIGPGYTGPTVAGERLYVTDRVKTPVAGERVLCLDWKTGKTLWTHSYPCRYRIGYSLGPRASVTVADGRAYSLGAMGHLLCLDAAKGTVLWQHDLSAEYDIQMPMWGIACAPLVEGGLVIVPFGGRKGACVAAFDVKTGKEVWRALEGKASYSAPIVLEQAGKRVAVCWTAREVAGLDAATGKAYWRYPFPSKMSFAMHVHTPVVDANRLYLTSFFDGSLMLKLAQDRPAVTKIWQRVGKSERETDALHSCISTAVFEGDWIYGVDGYGQLRCLKADSGDRVWEDKTATKNVRWGTIHFVRQGKSTWMFNEAGELILAELTPKGFRQIARSQLIEPTSPAGQGRKNVCWVHPAFAHKHIFIRNDKELICASLATGSK